MPDYIVLPPWPFAASLLVLIVITTLVLLFRMSKMRSRRKSRVKADHRIRVQAERELEQMLAPLCERASELATSYIAHGWFKANS